MDIVIDKSYAKGYEFPNRDINPQEKGESYCMQWSKAIYGRYVGGRTAWGPDKRKWWHTMRAYSRGEQDIQKYKSWLTSDLSEDGGSVDSYDDAIGNSALGRRAKREGWYNLLWDVVSPASKIMNSLHGMFDDVEYDLYVDVVDAKSRALQEQEKWKTILLGRNAEWQAEYKRKAGIPVDEVVPLPKSEEEFDVRAANEGFKLGVAKAMQKLVRVAVDHDSEWVDVLKKKLIDSFFVCSAAAARDWYDPEEKRFKAKYADIADVIIQYSKEFDFNDSEYGGVFSVQTISFLKKKRPDISENEWKSLARNYMGRLSNPSDVVNWGLTYDVYDSETGCWKYDSFKVLTLEAEWIDYDITKALSYRSVHGRETYHRIGYDTEIKPLSAKQIERGARQEVVERVKRRLYECTWVVGSDIVFDYGPVRMAPKDGDYRPTLRLKVEQLQQKSIIEQLYPVFDQFFIAWLRYQNSMAKMIERGYAVNMSMLMNVTDGTGRKMSLEDIFDLWRQVGILPYMVSIAGNYQGGAVSPVMPIDGGLGERLAESIRTFEWCFWMIENITGLNPVALGSTPKQDTPVTTMQMSLQATSNSLKPVINALMELKKNTATNLLRRIQVGLRNDVSIRKSYAGAIGVADVDALVVAEKDLAKYGLTMNFRPGTAFKEKLREYIRLCLQPGRNGVTRLDPNDAMFFEERLDQGGDLIEIRQQIAYTIEKNKQRDFAEQQAHIDRQNQGLMAQQQQKSQYEAQMKQMEAELKAMQENLATTNKLRVDRANRNSELFAKLAEQGPEATNELLAAAGIMGDLSVADLPVVLARLRGMAQPPPTQGRNMPPEGFSPEGGAEHQPGAESPPEATGGG